MQKAQLGAAGASLALNSGPGRITNSYLGFNFFGDYYQPYGSFAKLGRITGYGLSYGSPFVGSTGVMEIRSSVEVYKTRADANKGLAEWRDVESGVSESSPVLSITEEAIGPPPIGQRRFGWLITLAAANLNPIVRLDEQVAAGRFVLDLTVTAGSASAAEDVAPHLLRVLHHRLQLMLGGYGLGKPVTLPPKPKVGQTPGGPDLSTMGLRRSDIGQGEAVTPLKGYYRGAFALSAYFMILKPAGPYEYLSQRIHWWPTASEATYAQAYARVHAAESAVDVTAVGDNARGYLETVYSEKDAKETMVYVTLTNGRAEDYIYGPTPSTLQASDVQSLAQAAANRLDAALGP